MILSDRDLFVVKQNTRLPQAMKKMDENSHGIVFVVDEKEVICGSVSDGDVRRWILKGEQIDSEVSLLMNKRPLCIEESLECDVVDFMLKHSIKSVPIVDRNRHIIDIKHQSDSYIKLKEREDILDGVSVVIMAGGKGTRLYPYTKILPKPLIPIGEIPIVERIMDSFYEYGVKDYFMSVNYKKNMIESYFYEANKDYDIKYIEEEKPLGTGGSLKLIKTKFEKPIIVANCDSLVKVDYSQLYKHHIINKNAITIVTSLKNDTIPYGVVYSSEDGVLDYMEEKPTRSYMINTGMYVVNPDMINIIEDDVMFHMTQLVQKAKEFGYKVGIYPVSEDSFLDMGEFAEMKRMEEKLGFIK